MVIVRIDGDYDIYNKYGHTSSQTTFCFQKGLLYLFPAAYLV